MGGGGTIPLHTPSNNLCSILVPHFTPQFLVNAGLHHKSEQPLIIALHEFYIKIANLEIYNA